jgi:hypothetical protein
MDMKLRRLEAHITSFTLGLSNPGLVISSVFPPTSLVGTGVAGFGMNPTAMINSIVEILASLRRRIEELPSYTQTKGESSSSSVLASSMEGSQLLTADKENKLKLNLELLKNELSSRVSASHTLSPISTSSSCALSLISFYSFSTYASTLPTITQRLKEVENLGNQIERLKELIVNIHDFIVSDDRSSTSSSAVNDLQPHSVSLVSQLKKTVENCSVVQKNFSLFSTNVLKEMNELEELMVELRKLKKKK